MKCKTLVQNFAQKNIYLRTSNNAFEKLRKIKKCSPQKSKLKNVLRKFAHEKMILNKKKKLAKIAIVRKKLMRIFTSFMKIGNSQI